MNDERLTDEQLDRRIADLEQGPTPPVIRVYSDTVLAMARELKATQDMYNTLHAGLAKLLPEMTHDPADPSRSVHNVARILDSFGDVEDELKAARHEIARLEALPPRIVPGVIRPVYPINEEDYE